MGRRKLHDAPVRWNLHVPQSLHEEVERVFRDPIFNKPQYGARAAVCLQLLREALDDIRAGRKYYDPLAKRIKPVRAHSPEEPRNE